MSYLELHEHIGQRKLLRVEQFKIGVRIVDVKRAYGNTRFLVEVLDGYGQAWVDSSRLIDDTPTIEGNLTTKTIYDSM